MHGWREENSKRGAVQSSSFWQSSDWSVKTALFHFFFS